MKRHVYANGELIGWAELVSTDPPMGCVSGSFYPNDNYKKIRPVIREHHLYDGSFGKKDEKTLEEVQTKIRVMCIVAVTEDGEVLDPVGGVHIDDFSEELDEDPYQLDVLGLDHDTFTRLFPLAYQEYLNRFNVKEQD
jgi:hypothetical protein